MKLHVSRTDRTLLEVVTLTAGGLWKSLWQGCHSEAYKEVLTAAFTSLQLPEARARSRKNEH